MNSEVLKSLSIPAKHKLLIDEATWVNFEKMTCPRLNKAHRQAKTTKTASPNFMLRLQTYHKSSCYLPSAAIKLQFNLNKKGFFIAKKQMKILTSQLRNTHLAYEKWEDAYSYCLGRCSLTDKISVLETVRDTKGRR